MKCGRCRQHGEVWPERVYFLKYIPGEGPVECFDYVCVPCLQEIRTGRSRRPQYTMAVSQAAQDGEAGAEPVTPKFGQCPQAPHVCKAGEHSNHHWVILRVRGILWQFCGLCGPLVGLAFRVHFSSAHPERNALRMDVLVTEQKVRFFDLTALTALANMQGVQA